MSDVRTVRQSAAAADAGAAPARTLSSDDSPLLATALARSFELVAGIALFALTGTALVVALVPRSTATRVGFAVELVFLGVCMVGLSLLLSRRSARAVTQPLQELGVALAAITEGDFAVRVGFERAAAEIREVGESANTMARELERLRAVEIDRAKDERARRQLAESVHASLDREWIATRAAEVVGSALDVDRVHIRLRDPEKGRLVAEWRRADAVASLARVAPVYELHPLEHVLGVTDDRSAVVVDDAGDASRFGAAQLAAFEELHIRAAIKYPLVLGNHVEGVLVASCQFETHSWSDSDVSLMEGFAREIGRALDHSLAFDMQKEAAGRLAVLDRAKNEFLAEVSRSLRGPLASVTGYIELLTDPGGDPATDEQRHMLSVIERNGEQLLVLIDDLLTMSQIEAGTFVPEIASVSLTRIIGHVRGEVSSAVVKGALDLDVRLEPNLHLLGDEKQIQRALLNLVANAVKFTPSGGRIEVTARSDDGLVVIEVRDTGIGIAVDEQDELFTRFFNAKAGSRHETLGTGLGLYLVKQIVEGHGGTVDVRSVPGKGSTFTMRLPAVSSGRVDMKSPAQASSAVSDRLPA